MCVIRESSYNIDYKKRLLMKIKNYAYSNVKLFTATIKMFLLSVNGEFTKYMLTKEACSRDRALTNETSVVRSH